MHVCASLSQILAECVCGHYWSGYECCVEVIDAAMLYCTPQAGRLAGLVPGLLVEISLMGPIPVLKFF